MSRRALTYLHHFGAIDVLNKVQYRRIASVSVSVTAVTGKVVSVSSCKLARTEVFFADTTAFCTDTDYGLTLLLVGGHPDFLYLTARKMRFGSTVENDMISVTKCTAPLNRCIVWRGR